MWTNQETWPNLLLWNKKNKPLSQKATLVKLGGFFYSPRIDSDQFGHGIIIKLAFGGKS